MQKKCFQLHVFTESDTVQQTVFTFMWHILKKKNIGNICLLVNIAVFCSWDREIPQYWENSDRYIQHRWRCTCWMCPGGNKDHPGKWKVSNSLQWTVFCGSCDVSIIFFLHLEITKISCPTIMGLCMFVFCVCAYVQTWYTSVHVDIKNQLCRHDFLHHLWSSYMD